MFWVLFCLFFELKTSYGVNWLKIFSQNSSNGSVFRDFEHVMFSDENNLYSIFKLLNSKFLINNSYEFLLEYPEFTGYNRWRQQLLPWNNNETIGFKAQGYEAISISWSGQSWGGLVRSNNPYETAALLDGSAGHNNWHYAIGCVKNYYTPKMPGPNDQLATQVKLWIRLDNLNLLYIPTKENRVNKISLVCFVSLISLISNDM